MIYLFISKLNYDIVASARSISKSGNFSGKWFRERCFPITTKLFQSRLVNDSAPIPSTNETNGEIGCSVLNVAGESWKFESSPLSEIYVCTYGGSRNVKVNLRAERRSREWRGNGRAHGITCVLCVPVLFSLLLFIARNRILKLGLSAPRAIGPRCTSTSGMRNGASHELRALRVKCAVRRMIGAL